MLDNIIDLNLLTRFFTNLKTYITGLLTSKQDVLVSGVNIKTINNESLTGNGNINVGNKPVEVVTGIYMSVKPNIYCRNLSTYLTELSISLQEAVDDTILNEYLFEFTTSTSGTTISLPNTIKWANGQMPTFEANTTYQISVINNLGICTKFA